MSFVEKFKDIKEKFDKRDDILLDSEYHKLLKEYIDRLCKETCELDSFSDKDFYNIKEAEMSNLNRLQKMKNRTSYKKDKHKSKHKNEDWG